MRKRLWFNWWRIRLAGLRRNQRLRFFVRVIRIWLRLRNRLRLWLRIRIRKWFKRIGERPWFRRSLRQRKRVGNRLVICCDF